MLNPRIEIDLKKIEENTRLLVNLCESKGISQVVGVNKACCADVQVVRAMLKGGIQILGDSRLDNLKKIYQAGIQVPLLQLRLPMFSQIDEVVKYVDYSLNSQVEVIKELGKEAQKLDKVHQVILMVDLGDLREGVQPERVLEVVEQIKDLPGVRLAGLGTNLTCYGGVIPTPENLSILVELAEKIKEQYSLELEIISGGNSSSLQLLMENRMPMQVNHLRLGESILLGRETVGRNPLPGCHLDAFTIYAEVIELQEKPSVPIGILGQDAFGNTPVFKDIGYHWRAILAIGRQDTVLEGLSPLDERVKIIGASSDHLIIDVTVLKDEIKVGDEVAFLPNYGALLLAMTSPYLHKVYIQ